MNLRGAEWGLRGGQGGRGRGGGGATSYTGAKPLINSDAIQHYKRMFGPHRSRPSISSVKYTMKYI